MNRVLQGIRFPLGLIMICAFFIGSAQTPLVTSSSKIISITKEKISLQGINFGTNASNLKVFFGGVSVTPTAISDQFIDVTVPLGASYDFIRVTNTATGLSGAGEQSFLPSFGGQNPFDETKLGGQFDFQSESGLYDIALADFDGDGKLDVATANNNATLMSIFRNTGTPGLFNFIKTTLNPGVKTLHVAAGDFNGDGRPDVVASEVNGSRVFVFQNTSSVGAITFTMQSIILSGSKANQIKIEDLDLDGKPEMIVSDQAVSRIFIIKNQSTVSTVSFAAPQPFPLLNTAGTDGIAIGDMNGDRFPDIVVGEFLTATTNIFIIKNASAPGIINLIAESPIVLTSTVSNFNLGDLDNDGKADLAATLLLSSSVIVFGNSSVGDQITFAQGVSFNAGPKPWGMDFGDLDGDGKIDIAIASITQKSVTILNNQNLTGPITASSFVSKSIPTTYINRIVKLGDMDLDGRPDIAFTSIDDNNLGVAASKISIFRNLNCVVPVVTPAGPLTICNTLNQRLESSINATSTYQWFKTGVSQGPASAVSFFDVTTAGSYTVQMVEGTCSLASNAVQINVIAAAPLGPATITPVPSVCVNGTLNLSASNVGATQYSWTGPSGFSANGLSVSRPNFVPAMAGEYKLEVITGSCVAERLSVIVDVVSIPDVSVQFSGSDIICGGNTKLLSVFPNVTGFTYQWAEQASGDIVGATNSNYTANASGKYLIQLKSTINPFCPIIESPAVNIRVATLPIVDFKVPDQNCTAQNIQFQDLSVVDNDPLDPLVNYVWNFGDNLTSTDQNPTHLYSAANSYDVSLSVSYRDGSCSTSLQKPITISLAPSVQITSPNGLYSICSSDSVKLEVLGSFTSYLWDGGQTTPFIYAKQVRTYTVEVMAGCLLSASKAIGALNGPTVEATVNPKTINIGDVVVLSASGLQEYHWKPSASVKDPLSAITDATPPGATTYTVFGKASNGCYGEASVDVGVIAEDALSLLKPSIYFSPNGQPPGEVWTVENMDLLNQCGVTIYDERGFKVHEAKPYLNDWDGYSIKGQKLPVGVYFYIIQCDGSKRFLSGSINLIR